MPDRTDVLESSEWFCRAVPPDRPEMSLRCFSFASVRYLLTQRQQKDLV